MSIGNGGLQGQPNHDARAATVAAALGLIETGRAGEARDLLRDFMRGVPPAERCPFLIEAGVELRQGRVAIAARRLRAAVERLT
jgi:hypothetical protein